MKWVTLLRNLAALLIGVVFGFAIFGGLQYYFKPDFWISLLIAVLGGLYSALGPTLDLVKKGYEVRKLQYEVRKLGREEETAERERNTRIQAPTADELRRHGQSQAERTLEERFRNTSRDPLNPHPFVVDSDEQKL